MSGERSKSKSRGLGDTVAKVIKATGIKKLVKWVAGEDCGCEERQEFLNKLFPYQKPLCLTEKEYQKLNQILPLVKSSVTSPQQQEILKIHNRVFQRQDKATNCGKCVKTWVDNLKKLMKSYEGDTA